MGVKRQHYHTVLVGTDIIENIKNRRDIEYTKIISTMFICNGLQDCVSFHSCIEKLSF